MKKILSLMLSVCLMAAMMAGCRGADSNDTTGSTGDTAGSTQNTTPSTDPSTEPSTDTSEPDNATDSEAVSILSQIWDQFGEDERFATYGGTVENAVDNAPGALDLTYTEELMTKYLMPQQHLDKISEGASLVHMMNSNIFTSAVFRFTDAGEVETIAEDLYQNILNAQWICGSPDRLIIATVGEDALLMAFGSSDAMTMFQQKLAAAHADAKILQDTSIAA